MKALCFTALLATVIACSTPRTDQPAATSSSRMLSVSEGDQLFIAVHKVRPQAQAQYEQFMAKSWYPVARRLASKDAKFGENLRRRWRLVSVKPGSDSLLTYFFVYPASEGVGAGGTWGIYRAGGASDDVVVRDSTQWARWVDRAEGYIVVRKEY
jgi:hypothetical protein